MDATVYWSPGMSLDVLEQLVIQKAFKHYHGNKTATANSLGIAIRTLDAKLEKFEMDEIDKEAQHATRRSDRELQLARSRGFVSPGITQAYAAAQAEAGVRVQSVANAATEQPMPVPERQEIQEVLPKSASGNHSRKPR